MGVIAYDRPVRDFIAGLNATGHVTHTQHRKTKVTLHHNGGRLSLQGILEVWKVRPASAHFQVDGIGDVGQYVLPNEYAWATGTTKGNQESISIEMANSTLAPGWGVSGATTYNAARLAGWLFAKIIGERPTRSNLLLHHDWKSTLCAGPYIDRVYSIILQQTQEAYDLFTQVVAPELPTMKGEDDMGVRLVKGDSTQQVPGKDYTYGDFVFLLKLDPTLPGNAVRSYVAEGSMVHLLMKDDIEEVDQGKLDKVLYAEGGRPPASTMG